MTMSQMRVSVASTEVPQLPHALYRFYDRTDVLLYLGISINLPARLRQHRGDKDWWPNIDRIQVEYHPTRQAALDAEKAAIKAEKPVHNDVHNDMTLVPLSGTADTSSPAVALARRLLRVFEEEDLDAAMAGLRGQGDDLELVERLTWIYWGDRRRLCGAIESMMEMLPATVYASCQQQALHELNEEAGVEGEADFSTPELLTRLAEVYAEHLADTYLNGLAAEERDAWLQCARVYLAPHADHCRVAVVATRFARDFRERGLPPRGMCEGPGKHGATCDALSDWACVVQEPGPRMVTSELCDGHLRLADSGEWLRADGSRVDVTWRGPRRAGDRQEAEDGESQ
jgi:hypothetical protein